MLYAHLNATSRDEHYVYDTLDRLTARDRGDLAADKSAISGTPTQEEDWTLDALGNWGGYATKAAGTTDLSKARSHNTANELNPRAAARSPAPLG